MGIPIEIKTSRSGLGREEAVKKVLETKSKLRQKHLEQSAKRESQQEVSAQEFRNQLSRQHKSKKTESDLYRSQKTCCQLDQSKGFTEPVETWFWPEAKDDNDELEDDNVELKDEEYCDEHTDNTDGSEEEGESIVELSNIDDVKEPKKN